MRIMLCCDTYPPEINGVAASVHNLAYALAERGHAVLICTIMRMAPPNAEAVRDPFRVVRLPAMKLPLYPDFSIAAPIGRSITPLMRAFRHDIVHCHTPWSIGWRAIRAGRALGAARLGTHHTLFGEYVSAYSKLGNHVNQHLATAMRRYVAAFYNQCHLTSCASRYLANDLITGGVQRPVVIVPNPVDTERFRPLPWVKRHRRELGEVRLVYFGRLAREKNLPHLISLIEPVLCRHPRVTCAIVGDGPVRSSLEAQVRQLGLEARIRFTGFLRGDDLLHEVASSDIYVSASLTENQPMAILESLACGVPVVALAAAGVPEIIQDGAAGYLVDPASASAVFAERIERLVTDSELRDAMSRYARRATEGYTRAACLESMLQTYEQTLTLAAERQRGRCVHLGRGAFAAAYPASPAAWLARAGAEHGFRETTNADQ